MKKRSMQVICTIFLILFSCYALFPFLWVITSSLKSSMEIFTGVLIPSEWRWDNFSGAWEQANISRVIVNSLIVTIFSVGIGLTIDVLAGYSFAKLAIKKHSWIFYIFLMALAIPLEANVFSIYLQVKQLGLGNTLGGLVIALIGTGSAFGTYLMRNFFRDISDTFRESAKIDGASELKIFFNIYLPLAAPAIGALTIFKALQSWNEYNISLFILTDQKKWTIPLAVATFKSFEYSNYSYIFAASVISFLPTVILYILFNKSFIEGIAVGGEKG